MSHAVFPATKRLASVIGVLFLVAHTAWTAPDDHWANGFYCQGVDNYVWAAVLDGSGNLYIGGEFRSVHGQVANYVAKWDGSTWSPLGAGMDGPVRALAFDGSGNLYAGGGFNTAGGVAANSIAKWDGTTWSALGSGVNYVVAGLAIDASGNVYAGGNFTTAGGAQANYVAKWNGSTWSALGSGMNGLVNALAVDGSGNVYAGGYFTAAGGAPANKIAKWNGSTWSALGSGISSDVWALVSDTSGNVYVGGYFATAGGVTANSIAKWDGTAWSSLGSGMDYRVYALAMDGTGNVYAGGAFATAGGVAVNYIAKWNGATWSALGSGMNGDVNAVAADASGNVYAGGAFATAGGAAADCIAKWNGSSWGLIGTALGLGMSGAVCSLAVDGLGNVYAGGDFTTAGGVSVNHIAKWNGSTWSALGSGMNNIVRALAVDGSGNVYAGGDFNTAGGVVASSIAKWDGTTWSALGSGMNNIVRALAVDGSGNVYAGGDFTTAGGVSVNFIAKWDGSTWSPLAMGLWVGLWSYVAAVAVDVSGNVYAGGGFTRATSGVVLNHIAKWDGSTWSALGSGMDTDVCALAVDGSGDLYAGGDFTTAGGVAASYIAKWNASSWSALGSGANSRVAALAAEGNGSVYAGGYFATAGGVSAKRIARWDGTNWSALGSGTNGTLISALAVTGSLDVYAGGDFVTAGGKISARFGRWFNTRPTNAALPTVSGTHVVGNTVNATTGGWNDTDGDVLTLSYQWQRADNAGGAGLAAIAGATANAYTLTTGDAEKYVSVQVTADDGCGGTARVTTGWQLVAKITQTISFAALGSKTFGDPPFAVSATASSGLAVAFSIASGPATINGDQVAITGAGTVTVRASQAGDAAYCPAPDVDQSFTVAKASQTISFGALSSKTYGDGDFDPAATASSGLAVDYASDNLAVATIVAHQVHIVGAGSCTITASQAGNGNYNAAPNVPRTLDVAKANQTITFGPLPTKTLGEPDFDPGASSSSGLPVSYSSSDTAVAALAGGQVRIVGPGTATITASQSGNANWNAAPDATQTLNVQPATPPAITSPLTASATKGQPFSYQITASGSLPLTFSASNLPAGLNFTGDTISGSPTVSGAVYVTLGVSNAGGADSKTLRLAISHGGSANYPPVVYSSPAASANPATAGQPVQLSANFGDADGDLMVHTWDFGDGTTATGATATHTYAAPGIYTVTVTATDGQTANAQTFVLAVNEAGVGDDQTAFTITKMQLKFCFTAAEKDSLSLSGTLPVPIGFTPGGKTVRVLIGGLDESIPLGAKGKGAANNASLKLSGKAKKGVFTASPAKFQLKIAKRTLFPALERFGFVNADTATALRLPVQVFLTLDGVIYARETVLLYKATQGKSGKAKKLVVK